MNEIEQIINSEQGGGVFREILKTPLFKEILRDYLNNIDPQTGSSSVKTFLWEDPEVLLSTIGALPPIINSFIGAFSELGKQMSSKFPPQLLKNFIVSIWNDIDKEEFNAGLSAYGSIIKGILDESPELRSALLDALKAPGAKAIGNATNSASRYINKMHQEDPKLIGEIISGAISTIDKGEFSKASTTVANAALDQKPPFVSWGARMIGGRIRAKFKRKK